MKLNIIALLAAFYCSSLGHAEVKPPGTPVPKLCSPQALGADLSARISGICYGSVAGSAGDYVILLIRQDDSTLARKLLRITTRQSMGPNQIRLLFSDTQGQTSTGIETYDDGDLVSLRGKTAEGLKFSATKFQVVFTTR